MSENKPIPKLTSYEEMAEFWDTHSLVDYWEHTEPAEFEVSDRVRRRYLIPVDRDLLVRLGRLAQSRGVSIETLANLLLEQRLDDIEAHR